MEEETKRKNQTIGSIERTISIRSGRQALTEEKGVGVLVDLNRFSLLSLVHSFNVN